MEPYMDLLKDRRAPLFQGAGLTESVRDAVHPRDSRESLPVAAPADFTYSAYRAMLKRLLGEGYRFITFPEAAPALKPGSLSY